MADTNNYHIDEQEKQVVEDEGSSVPIRTKHYSSYYGCTFCKRGFTKAQALGGHMNIHRKHKSLIMKKKGSKQLLEVNNANSSSSSSNYKVSCSNNSIEESSLEVQTYKNLERNNYYPSSSSSSLLYVSESYLNNDGKQDENIGGGNLSLQVGPTHLEEENGEVDLELRLGHYPQ